MSNFSCGVHNCDFEQTSKSCLPTLPPRAGIFARIIRTLSKGRLPTFNHKVTVRYFKSEKSLIDERHRLIKVAPWYVIHPFSNIAITKDIVICHVFIMSTIVGNMLVTFKPSPRTEVMFRVLSSLEAFSASFFLLNFLICMVTGYIAKDAQEIELRPKKLLIKYLKTYAVFDLVLCLPILKVFRFASPQALLANKFIVLARCVRFKTIIAFSRASLSIVYRVPKIYHDIIVCCMVILVMQHNFTCHSVRLPSVAQDNRRNISSMNTYLVPGKTYDIIDLYPIYYHVVLCHFYYAGRGSHGITEPEECIYYVTLTIISFFLNIYLLACVWCLIKNRNKNILRQQVLLAGLNDYAIRKGLNQRLRYRILTYYKQKFRKKAFNERSFYANLSEHLQNELKLQSCYHIISNNSFFRIISKPDLGRIISNLRPLSFCAGEVVYNAHDPFVELFLISRGTVALYSEHGNEVIHLQDCDMVGVFAFFVGSYLYTCVAIEYSEMYVLPRDELNTCIEKYPSLVGHIQGQAKARSEKLKKTIGNKEKYRHAFNIEEVLESRQLRHEHT